MTTADWALIVSLCSFFVATASFAWNVWSKFIYPKPKVAVSVGVFNTYMPGKGPGASFIRMIAVNHGPGHITLTHAVIGEPRLFRRPRMMGLLNIMVSDPDSAYPEFDLFGSGQLPRKLDVGEEFGLNMSASLDLFEEAKGERRMGYNDSFGKTHWAPKAATRKLKRDLQKDRKDLKEAIDASSRADTAQS